MVIPHHTMQFSVEMVSQSQNPWERQHWTARMKDKEDWFWLVKAAAGVKDPAKEKKHVHIIRVGERLIDDQNVPAGCKYLVDALQAFGHIWRDSRSWTRVTFDQRKCRKDEVPHMEVTISSQQEPS